MHYPASARQARQRDLYYFTNPQLWPTWPFLALVRRHPDREMELGVLYDFKGTNGPTGFSSTVFLVNLVLVPHTLDGLLALPREVYDTPEEMAEAGWMVD